MWTLANAATAFVLAMASVILADVDDMIADL